jgi:hypothetical protein
VAIQQSRYADMMLDHEFPRIVDWIRVDRMGNIEISEQQIRGKDEKSTGAITFQKTGN